MEGKVGSPIKPLKYLELKYFKQIQEFVLKPLQKNLQKNINELSNIKHEWFSMINDVFAQQAQTNERVFYNIAKDHVDVVNNKQRKKMITTFMAAFSLDISKSIDHPNIDLLIVQKIEENVKLIKSITPTILQNIIQDFVSVPFDQQAIIDIINKNTKVGQSRAKFIARDQTSKLTGDLNVQRNLNIGVQKYKWSATMDNRTRQTHRENDGKVFRYDTPPANTGHPGHDYNCRCTALPIFDKEKYIGL